MRRAPLKREKYDAWRVRGLAVASVGAAAPRTPAAQLAPQDDALLHGSALLIREGTVRFAPQARLRRVLSAWVRSE